MAGETIGDPADASGTADDPIILEQAAPIVRRVVIHRLGGACPDVDDVCSQVLLDLLQNLRHQRSARAAANLAGYVAAAANHGCDHYVRRKHPLRWRLRNRVRYALENDGRFALWKDPENGLWWSGRRSDRGAARGDVPDRWSLRIKDPRRLDDVLAELFRVSGGPVPLIAVVEVLADLLGVPSGPAASLLVDHLPDTAQPADIALIHREDVARTWEQIQALPLRQRQALLLNLKLDAIDVLLAGGTASLRDIAEALEMAVGTLAALWPDLPLADNLIAERLACSRQQVINLRLAARRRLANRLAGWS
jgi:hypothetical protein